MIPTGSYRCREKEEETTLASVSITVNDIAM
jgi:hypothetical protein